MKTVKLSGNTIPVETLDDSQIIRRLERASQRMKHFVDVGLIEGGDRDVQKYVNDYRRRIRKA